jgi:hypothetical protein
VAQERREARKAAEAPPHRRAGSTARAQAGLRRVLVRRPRRRDLRTLSRLKGGRRAI